MGSSPIRVATRYASVAQLVEQGTENPRVVGSIPTGGTICGFSSFGRARPCQGRGGGFEPRNPLQKNNAGRNFGIVFLSKTEGLGMAPIRKANCMELRLVRVWHQPIGCISSTSVSIPYRNSLRIPCAHFVSNSIHGFAVIKSTLVVLFLFLGRMKGLEVGAV